MKKKEFDMSQLVHGLRFHQQCDVCLRHWGFLHQSLDERMNLDLNVGIIAAAILSLSALILDDSLFNFGRIVEVCRIHSHQAERQDETVAA